MDCGSDKVARDGDKSAGARVGWHSVYYRSMDSFKLYSYIPPQPWISNTNDNANTKICYNKNKVLKQFSA